VNIQQKPVLEAPFGWIGGEPKVHALSECCHEPFFETADWMRNQGAWRSIDQRWSGCWRTSIRSFSKPRQAMTPSTAASMNNQALRPVEPGT
jgi:hypothetical protein